MLPTCDFPRLELVGATQSSTFCSTNTVLQAKQHLLSQIFSFDKVQKLRTYVLLQGDPTQTVKSNLALTDRKHAINFNLMVDSDQGWLGI